MAGHRGRGSEGERARGFSVRISLAEARRLALRDEIPSTGELNAMKVRAAVARGWSPSDPRGIDEFLNDDDDGGTAA
jgi:hypothetical protein